MPWHHQMRCPLVIVWSFLPGAPSGSGDIMIISLCLLLVTIHGVLNTMVRVTLVVLGTLLAASPMSQYTAIIPPEEKLSSLIYSRSSQVLLSLSVSWKHGWGKEVTSSSSKNEDTIREKKAVFVGFDIHIFIWRAQNKITKTCSEEIRSHQHWKWQGKGHSHFFVEPFLQN